MVVTVIKEVGGLGRTAIVWSFLAYVNNWVLTVGLPYFDNFVVC